MKCLHCGTETESTGKRPKKYCSDKCRMAYKRTNEQITNEQITNEQPKKRTEETNTLETNTLEEVANEHNVPDNYGQPDCECRHCANAAKSKSGNVLNHGAYKPAGQLGYKEINRVSLPGDADYDGVCLRPEYDSRRINTA